MIKKLHKKLIQYTWYRNLFQVETYVYVSGRWKHINEFRKGDKITDVSGRWNTQFFCHCGNELVHSQSHLYMYCVDGKDIHCYCCSYCKAKKYGRPDLVPGMLHCDSKGCTNPLRARWKL